MLVTAEYVPSPLSWNVNAGPDIDIAGIVVVALTTAPLTGLPDASLREIEIASLPCFGGDGSKDIVIAKSPEDDAGANVVAEDDDDVLDPQPANKRASPAETTSFFIVEFPFTVRGDRRRHGAGRRRRGRRAPARARQFLARMQALRARRGFPVLCPCRRARATARRADFPAPTRELIRPSA